MLANYATPMVAKFLRTQRSRATAMSLSYNDVRHSHVRRHRGGRGHDGGTWTLAAWATIKGLSPVVVWKNQRGTRLSCPPFQGELSALAWLQEQRDNSRSPLRGEAIRILDRLAQEDLI